MAGNYVLLETIALTQSAASVTFDNLPTSGYTDLKIVVSGRAATNTFTAAVRFNGSSSGYSYRRLGGYGSGSPYSNSSSSATDVTAVVNSGTYTSNTFANTEIYIPNYRSSNFKSVSMDGVSENNATGAETMFEAGLWSNTAAITSISITQDFVAGSTFSLYGVAALGTTPVLAPQATGGNRVENDGTYWIHTFLSSGTFTPQVGLTCDYLVVAGGGGGGSQSAPGGGGGGGLRSTVTATGGGGSLESPISVASGTPYAITVGGGGTAGAITPGGDGSNSVFSTITSTGGGGGGGTGAQNGRAGGSGGGGAAANPASSGGSPTSNQGFAGGTGFTDTVTTSRGGGGGGAGAIGTNGTVTGGAGSGVNGNGGNGVATSISGSSVTYAGGGGGSSNGYGGGTGGTGGGTAGNGAGTATAATANTGGGAGASTNATGAAGGSGIVIIRYPIA